MPRNYVRKTERPYPAKRLRPGEGQALKEEMKRRRIELLEQEERDYLAMLESGKEWNESVLMHENCANTLIKDV